MGLMKIREESGGAEFEVREAATVGQIKQLGELRPECMVYDVQTTQQIPDNAVLIPGRSYGDTVRATLGR